MSALHVIPEAGTEIAADAPVDLSAQLGDNQRAWRAEGAFLRDGLPLGDVRGKTFEGTLEVQICEKATGVCQPETLHLSAAFADRKRGSQVLAITTPSQAPPHESPFNRDATEAAEGAFERARSSGDRVLLDFSAVWCPPCNLLAAEVLHADDASTVLAGLQVAIVDVDHASSWALKDRYAIGSYPTVVVTDAAGVELGRQVGYAGRAGFLDFLAQADTPARDWAKLDPATLTPDEAAVGALALLDARHEDLGPWIARVGESTTLSAHLARFRHAPNADDLGWLVEHHPERALDWLPHAGDWAEGPGKQAVRDALPAVVLALGPVEAADALWYGAQLEPEATAQTLYATSATLLRSSFTGDFAKDRAHLSFLATLMDRAGQHEEAVTQLDTWSREHPEEPTFLLAAADLLNEHGKYDAALRRGELALTRAWGDNRLRVAAAVCTSLVGLGRQEEAAQQATAVLELEPAPADGLVIRTHRYRKILEAFVE